MGLRVARQTETTLRLAKVIESHRNVAACAYPGLASHPQAAIIEKQMTGGGSVLAFDVGGQEAAWRVLNALQIVDISNNLGDAKSMATHPTTTTHRSVPEEERLAMGLTPGWVRLSVGLEGAEDLERDIVRALDAARG
jgi:O-succinylhomoserine sulfhydrylase